VLVFLALFSRDTVVNATGNWGANSTVTLTSQVPNAVADSNTTLTIPSGDLNFSQIVSLTPSGASVADGPPGNPAGTPILGDVVGNIAVSPTLGINNAPCSTALPLNFILMNGTTDINHTINPRLPSQVGPEGVLGIMRADDDGDTVVEAEDSNGLPNHVDHYPSYLNTMFDPGGGALTPKARYSGSLVVNGLAIVLIFMIFDPGQLGAFAAPNVLSDMGDASLGIGSVTVLQDPTQPAAPGAITDFCSPLTAPVTTFGNAKLNPCNGNTLPPCNTEAGINTPAPGADTGRIRYRNPATAGTYQWLAFNQSMRDLDNDGIENQFDTCPNDATPTYNPRSASATHDPDTDMLASACDPADNTTNNNEDGDTASNGAQWPNALDNCPLIVNPSNADSEVDQPHNLSTPRGGPRGDGIGDECDPDDVRSNGHFHTTLSVIPKCINTSGNDSDSDGWCNADETALGSNPSSSGSTPENYSLFRPFPVAHSGSGGNPPQRDPVQLCTDGDDNDGDGFIDAAEPDGPDADAFDDCMPLGMSATDMDGDGFSDEAEIHIGTDALGRCEVGSAATSRDWPSDSKGDTPSDDKVTLPDIGSFFAPVNHFNVAPTTGAPQWDPRYDLVPGGPVAGGVWIGLPDLGALIAGSTANPPMFGGASAFNGPSCTAHPMYGD
jgi:hypothetical protein